MKAKISILGSGPAGIQSAVYLLEHYYGEILLYDSDTDYAKGMVLDCMQAAAVCGWQGKLTAVDHINDLKQGKILIVTENNQRALEDAWVQAARDAKFTIYASSITNAIKTACEQGVPEMSIAGVQGMVDARILAGNVAQELGISVKDVHAMVYGGTGNKMKSNPDLVRVHGIPIDTISKGLFDKVLSLAKSQSPYEEKPWAPQYTLAAAAVELALVMESGQNVVLPITGASETFPCLVGNLAIQKTYKDLV